MKLNSTLSTVTRSDVVRLVVVTSLLAVGLGFAPANAGTKKGLSTRIYDSYYQMNGQNYYNYYLVNAGQVIQSSDNGAIQAWAQAFTTPSGSPVEVKSYMAALTGRGGSVPTAVFQLVADQGNLPNMSQVFDHITIRKITTDWNGRNYSFRSTNHPTLAPSTQYWLVLTTPTIAASLGCFAPSETSVPGNAEEFSDTWVSLSESLPCSEEILGTST